eukprot:1227215-Amphidinium_carterae.1
MGAKQLNSITKKPCTKMPYKEINRTRAERWQNLTACPNWSANHPVVDNAELLADDAELAAS